MSDANATLAGFVVSFSLLAGYAAWLLIAWRRADRAAQARQRIGKSFAQQSRATESVTHELKPAARVKTS